MTVRPAHGDSVTSNIIRWMVQEGYSVDQDGTLRDPQGVAIMGYVKDKGGKRRNACCYYYVTVGPTRAGRRPVPIHRLVAFLKFGEASMAHGTVTRHLNGQSLDNRWDNIEIGTDTDNAFDKSPEARRAHAKKAARARRRFNDDQVKSILQQRAKGAPLKALSAQFKCSAGTLSDIVRGKQYGEFDALRVELGLIPERSHQ